MTLFGITGGIGMGKSTAGDLLLGQGYSLVDTDIIAREIVAPGQDALQEIAAAFGPTLLAPTGELRRDELARIVFTDAAARRRLEEILHPRIRERWQRKVEEWRSAGKSCGFVIIPLLFETEAAAYFDSIICVACSAESQRARLQKRNWDEAQIRNRVSAQWPVERKINGSNFVVWTDTTLEMHRAQLNRILLSVP